MSASIAAAALLGLASVPHCMGMCGPIAASCGPATGSQATYQLLRLGTYSSLGALAATLVAPLRDRLPTGAFTWSVAILTALALLVSARRLVAASGGNRSTVVPAARLVRGASGREVARAGALGVVTGLLPCGSLYGALAVAAVAGSSSVGALTMAAFALVSGGGLALTQVAARRLLLDEGRGGRPLVAAALVVGALLSLGRPWLASRDAASCHDAATTTGAHEVATEAR